MFSQITYLELWNKQYKIFEPTISDLFLIEYLMEGKDNIEENIKYIFQLLNIPEKYISYASIIIKQVLESFIKEKENSWWKSYFLWDLWLLAHHNFMGTKEFMETHYLSNIKEIGNIREYYMNLMNDKSHKNDKFINKREISNEDEAREIREFKERTWVLPNQKNNGN